MRPQANQSPPITMRGGRASALGFQRGDPGSQCNRFAAVSVPISRVDAGCARECSHSTADGFHLTASVPGDWGHMTCCRRGASGIGKTPPSRSYAHVTRPLCHQSVLTLQRHNGDEQFAFSAAPQYQVSKVSELPGHLDPPAASVCSLPFVLSPPCLHPVSTLARLVRHGHPTVLHHAIDFDCLPNCDDASIRRRPAIPGEVLGTPTFFG